MWIGWRWRDTIIGVIVTAGRWNHVIEWVEVDFGTCAYRWIQLAAHCTITLEKLIEKLLKIAIFFFDPKFGFKKWRVKVFLVQINGKNSYGLG